MIDTIFTAIWLKTGLAYEANPIMAYAYALSPATFIAVKFIVCAGALYLLWIAREKRPIIVPLVSLILLVVYTWILLHHIHGCAELINSINVHQLAPVDSLIIPTGAPPGLNLTVPLF